MGKIKLTKEQKYYRKVMNREARKGNLKDKYGRTLNEPFKRKIDIEQIIEYIIVIVIITMCLYIAKVKITEYINDIPTNNKIEYIKKLI